MKPERFSLRLHPLLAMMIDKELEKTTDAVGFKHVSKNYWIVTAIKEKIERDNKTKV
jgi:hypothetical protein